MLRARTALLIVSAALFAGCSEDTGASEGGCVSTRDCVEGQVCLAGACVEGGNTGCSRDDDCSLGEYCDQITLVCTEITTVPCTEDVQCRPQQRCNTATNVCVDGVRPCAEDNPCAGDLMCDVAQQRCVECFGSGQCGAPAECVDGFCVGRPQDGPDAGTSPGVDAGTTPMCTADTQCQPPQTVCEGQQCVLSCSQAGGLMCPMGAVCDSTTGRCVTTQARCAGDGECNAPRGVCEGNQCVPGCAEFGGLQCAGGQVCNAQTGRCQAGGPVCTSDAQCSAPSTICNLNTGQCDPGCATAACTAPATCNTSTGHCTGGATCQDDNLENNDTAQSASTLGAGSIPSLGACPGDDDYYAVTLTSGAALQIDLTFQHGDGNIDVELLDPMGAVVASGRSATNNETLTWSGGTGTFIVHVFLTADMGPTPGNQYSMATTINGGSTCMADGLEPNNSIAAATPVMPGTGIGLNVCPGDDDFYAISVGAGERLTVAMLGGFFEGDIDIEVQDANGVVLDSSAGFGLEEIDFAVPAAGTYYIRVLLAIDIGSVEGNTYSLIIDILPAAAPATCVPDALEENDSAAAARTVAPGPQSSLTSCDADEDHYGVALAAGDVLTVDVTFATAEGDIEVELRDPAGGVVASSVTTTDNERVTFTAVAAGRHVLRVWLGRDAGTSPGNTYSMNVAVQGSGSMTCGPDMFEPNNTQAAASRVSPGIIPAMSVCTGDDDFYLVDVSNGNNLRVDLAFSHAEGDVDVQILDAGGGILARGLSTTDNESVQTLVSADGTLTIRVNLFQDTGSRPGNSYDLTITR